MSKRRISRLVTTPKFPPPPRMAQNRSGSCSALTQRNRPSAVTTSKPVTLSAASPSLRPYQPTPPPIA